MGGAAPGQRSRPRRPARAPGRSHAGAPLTGRSRWPRAPLCASPAPASCGEETGAGRARGRDRRPARLARDLGWERSAGRAPRVWRPPGCLLRPDHHRVSRTGSLCPAGRGEPRGAQLSPSVSRHLGWGAPRHLAEGWLGPGRGESRFFLSVLPGAPLTLLGKRMMFKEFILPGQWPEFGQRVCRKMVSGRGAVF